MNSLAFLVMLGAFALVLGWYVLNHERDADGREGVLGVRTDEAEEAGTAARGYLDAAARVRARAARLRQRR